MLFLYGAIQWTQSAITGINAGDGKNFFTLPQSGTAELANLETSSNTGLPGVFILSAGNGIALNSVLNLVKINFLGYACFNKLRALACIQSANSQNVLLFNDAKYADLSKFMQLLSIHLGQCSQTVLWVTLTTTVFLST